MESLAKKIKFLQQYKNIKLIFIISIISFLYFLAIGTDIIPYIRGPAPYPPDWRWEYYFVNTLSRIWFPLFVIGLIFFLFTKITNFHKNNSENKLIFILILLNFLLQMALLYYSRSGISVLLHRIINPDLNGYFTAALSIDSFSGFLQNFNKNVLSLPMHAQGHPPGAIIFFWLINKIAYFLPNTDFIFKIFAPHHSDVRSLWNMLQSYQKLGAIIAGFLIPFLSSITLVPLYYVTKYIYGKEAGINSIFLYSFIPSILLFIPINDVFLPLFSTISLFLFLKGINENNRVLIFFGGLILSFGIFFSLSLLPIIFMFFILFLISFYRRKMLFTLISLLLGGQFLLGFLILPILLFVFFKFNFIEVGITITSGLPQFRAYNIWVLYNLYDFFVFSGVPILIIFQVMMKYLFVNLINWRWSNIDDYFIAFLFMLCMLNFSGVVRGETARIWIPFVPFLVVIVAGYMTKSLYVRNYYFIFFLFLQAIQILVMQEFWVTLW